MYMSNIFIKGLMYLLLPSSVIMVLSSNNWLFMWIGLELNMLSFIPLMINTSNFQESDAMIKYFLIQALGSSLLLLSTSLMWINQTSWLITLMVITAMIMKLGMAPCHMWFPSVMSSISWWSCLILSTIQKIAPLSIMMYTFMNMQFTKFMIMISVMNVMIGGMIGMTQTKMKSIMAFSSITHMGWMVAAKTSYLPCTALAYLAMYAILISPLFIYMSNSNTSFSNQLTDKTSFSFNKMIMIPTLLLSLGGMPPLMGFIPKWLMIMYLGPNFMFIILLVLGSMMNLYFYLNIVFNSTIIQNSTHLVKTPMINTPTYMTLFTMISMFMLPLWASIVFMN